jgi:hypothetical protein
MISKQSFLFENMAVERPNTEGLTLARGSGRPLTKAERTFNRLIARIEALRVQLSDMAQNLDRALAYYGEHLHPRERRADALRKDLIRELAPFLDRGRLKKKGDREILRLILEGQLEALMEHGPLEEEDLRTVFKRVYGVGIEQAGREGIDELRSTFESMFGDLGVDIDLSDLRPDMSEAELAAKAAAMADEFQRKAEEAQQAQEASREGTRPKSKRQIEREERQRRAEELRRKSIASIYKQLARVLHPDLEQDSERREFKSALMQKLTAAYRDNDLHTLLSLELEWIHQEEGDIARLTEEKLNIYNQVLKEQAAELQHELNELPCHPRYQPIAVIDGPFGIHLKTDGAAEARSLDELIAGMEESLALLRSGNALAVVLEIVSDYRARDRAEKKLSAAFRRLSRSSRGSPF